MASDASLPARECRTCHATHRDDVPCPPVNKWLGSGQRLTLAERRPATAGTPVPTPARIWTDEQWAANHVGTCTAGVDPCGQPARLYPCGWRCTDHQPQPTPVTLHDQAAGVAKPA
jgi:hypothetical protein